MGAYLDHYNRSIKERDAFWADEARLIDWKTPPTESCDFSRPPFAKWFGGGTTNLCHNAVDRHVERRGEQTALHFISTETDVETKYSFKQLYAEVNRVAAMLQSLGVGKGDRVLIYMPMIPEAVFAMLATVRIGAIHSVVFGGFASASLATRIDDAKPTVIVSADAGMRMGKVVPYKPLLDAAIDLAEHKPAKVLLFDRGLEPMQTTPGRDIDWAAFRASHMMKTVPVEWVESSHPSYILYTSGTTGKPKGVQRDTGGYAVALTSSMKKIFGLDPGETMFCTSDIGWVVGHSYIVYGPLLNGNTTIMYEGVPLRPDPAIWWKICAENKVKTMFSSPTAVRVLKKQDPKFMQQHKLPALKYLFLAGEPLDEPTARWVSDALGGVAIVDNYWQTESGWPILSAQVGIEDTPRKFGSPSFPVYGFNVKLKSETGGAVGADEKAVLVIEAPLPPGALMTVWGDDERFVKTYFGTFSDEQVYSTFDWATRDKDGYYFILGRTDDVINVAGHRLGTREIEEAVQANPLVAECAVVGVADQLKGQIPVAFVVLKDPSQASDATKTAIAQTVDKEIGAIARPGAVHLVTLLPKTRSGKLLRRSIQALAEGRDPGDLTTIEDPAALAQIKAALGVK
ncbi:propionate--CoA ligase [Casimicrobium huifangae]|jgi:propionyl-CoA synthetase|uniref:propionate--CoA ligase n=1 Tax=Casimicrobium huifangae TaxID=2591109 RepID=UPI002C5A8CD5|nr:propionate--CoA ligase [Casimicrobium huifangae]